MDFQAILGLMILGVVAGNFVSWMLSTLFVFVVEFIRSR